MISTKGRYSIRILLDLAEHRNGGYIPMKEVAARQDISLKYIEKLMPALKAAGLLKRDPRSVERKKPGRKKARRSYQFSKR